MTKASKGKGTGGFRTTKQRVKTARGRSNSSAQWLDRQLNDPYVQRAKADGYRGRAAYKLIELNEKFKLLKPGMRVVDLGAAPGGWSQVASHIIGEKGMVLGIDLKEIDAVPGATFMVMDFLEDDAPERLKAALGGKADIVMSDMAANATGHTPTDHLRIMHLCELSLHFALEVLSPGGHFLCKVLKGGTENELLSMMKTHFTTVKHAKPSASRSDSAESYVVALGFKG